MSRELVEDSVRDAEGQVHELRRVESLVLQTIRAALMQLRTHLGGLRADKRDMKWTAEQLARIFAFKRAFAATVFPQRETFMATSALDSEIEPWADMFLEFASVFNMLLNYGVMKYDLRDDGSIRGVSIRYPYVDNELEAKRREFLSRRHQEPTIDGWPVEIRTLTVQEMYYYPRGEEAKNLLTLERLGELVHAHHGRSGRVTILGEAVKWSM